MIRFKVSKAWGECVWNNIVWFDADNITVARKMLMCIWNWILRIAYNWWDYALDDAEKITLYMLNRMMTICYTVLQLNLKN